MLAQERNHGHLYVFRNIYNYDSVNTIDSIMNNEAVLNEGTSELASQNNDSIFEEFLNETVPLAVPSFSNELQRYIDFKVDMVSSF